MSQFNESNENDNLRVIMKILRKRNAKTQNDLDFQDHKFKDIKFFSDYKEKLEEEFFTRLLKSLDYEKHNAKQILFRRGEKGTKFYIILKGSVTVMLEKKEHEVTQKTKPERLKLNNLFREFSYENIANHKLKTLHTVEFEKLLKFNDLSPQTEDLKPILMKSLILPSKKGISSQTPLNIVKIMETKKDDSNCSIYENSSDDGEIQITKPCIKINRPWLKFAWYIIKFWHEKLTTSESFRKNCTSLHTKIFKKYSISWLQNLLLSKYKDKIDDDRLYKIFPKYKNAVVIEAGAAFGEIALIKNVNRQATIYCNEDCHFAVIHKKNESDFDYLMAWEQREIRNFTLNFECFNYWTEKDKVSNLVQYLKRVTHMKTRDYIFKAGDNANSIFLLKSGEIELTLPNSVQKRGELINGEIIMKDKEEILQYKHCMNRVLKPYAVFGVEEVLMNFPKRIFTAQVKSKTCMFFELSKDKILIDLISRDPKFYKNLMQYSCIFNKSLCNGHEIDDFKYYYDESVKTCSKTPAELYRDFVERKQESLKLSNKDQTNTSRVKSDARVKANNGLPNITSNGFFKTKKSMTIESNGNAIMNKNDMNLSTFVSKKSGHADAKKKIFGPDDTFNRTKTDNDQARILSDLMKNAMKTTRFNEIMNKEESEKNVLKKNSFRLNRNPSESIEKRRLQNEALKNQILQSDRDSTNKKESLLDFRQKLERFIKKSVSQKIANKPWVKDEEAVTTNEADFEKRQDSLMKFGDTKFIIRKELFAKYMVRNNVQNFNQSECTAIKTDRKYDKKNKIEHSLKNPKYQSEIVNKNQKRGTGRDFFGSSGLGSKNHTIKIQNDSCYNSYNSSAISQSKFVSYAEREPDLKSNLSTFRESKDLQENDLNPKKNYETNSKRSLTLGSFGNSKIVQDEVIEDSNEYEGSKRNAVSAKRRTKSNADSIFSQNWENDVEMQFKTLTKINMHHLFDMKIGPKLDHEKKKIGFNVIICKNDEQNDPHETDHHSLTIKDFHNHNNTRSAFRPSHKVLHNEKLRMFDSGLKLKKMQSRTEVLETCIKKSKLFPADNQNYK